MNRKTLVNPNFSILMLVMCEIRIIGSLRNASFKILENNLTLQLNCKKDSEFFIDLKGILEGFKFEFF